MKNDPAFPSVAKEYLSDEIGGNWSDVRQPGLTKRELFAAMAMQGLASDISAPYWSQNAMQMHAAKTAVELADALIAELEKSK